MFSAEKLAIRLNRIFRNLLFHFIFWGLSFLIYVFLTDDFEFLRIHLNFFNIEDFYWVIFSISAIISLFFIILDGLFSDRFLRFFPRRLMIFFKSLLYLASVFIFLIIAANPSFTIFSDRQYERILNLLPEWNLRFIRFLVYFYLSGFMNNFLKGVFKIVGRGNFQGWVFGMYNKPREQERIFMFIDMKSSTTIAEKLQHKKYSHLVQDAFNDLSIVDNYQGQIYKYLGDGAIITWRLKDGLRNNNFLRAFYAYQRVINRRKKYYTRKYGIVPKFKAGVHAGKVMVLLVGKIRRDISYNGDTINTAARIEAMCNEYKQNLLISGDLYNLMGDEKDFNIKNVGNIKLKGKRKSVNIYQVKMKKT